MTKSESIAWFAGIYEGEGSFYYDSVNDEPLMAICMSDRDIIERAEETLLESAIEEISPRKENHKTLFRIKQAGKPAIKSVSQIWDYLGIRRKQQVRDVIEECDRSVYKDVFEEYVSEPRT